MPQKTTIIIFILFSGLSFSPPNLYGWELMYDKIEIADTLYSLREETSFNQRKFPFYNEVNLDIIKRGGINLKLKKGIFLFSIPLKKNIKTTIQNLKIKIDFYMKNIESYEISIHFSENDLYYYKKIQPTKDGYQNIELRPCNISDNSESHASPFFLCNCQTNDAKEIKHIEIKVFPNSDKANFIIGDFFLLKEQKNKEKVYHPHINELFGNNDSKNTIKYRENPLYIFSDISYSNAPLAYWYIEQGKENNKSEKQLLIDLFKICIAKYPFYKERNISKELINKKLEKVLNQTKDSDIYSLSDQLNSVAALFNDGHFKISHPPTKQTPLRTSPVRLIRLNDSYYVSAILLKGDYSNLIGRKILFIDTLNISNLIDKQEHKCIGNLKLDHYLSEYINKKTDDSTFFVLKTLSGQDTSFYISHASKIIVPPNFKPRHGDFQMIEKVAYYRINNFIPGDYIHFLTYLKEIKKANGIIFDLRGNGGGDMDIAMNIASLFLKDQSVIKHEIDLYGNKRSILMRKNPHFRLTLPVVILIDEYTACASEFFIDVMRERAKAILIGKSASSGQYAWVKNIEFPSGVTVKTNIFSNKYYTCSSDKNIEATGISPDIYVDITNVSDLYPYEDKIKQIAVKYINANKNNQ